MRNGWGKEAWDRYLCGAYPGVADAVTTAVTKDRVLGHNPAAALYTAEGYYKKKLFSEDNND